MANDSLLRLRQLNKPEISGYILEVTKNFALTGQFQASGTGSLTGSFYPLKNNISGFVTGNVVRPTDTGNLVDLAYLSIIQDNIFDSISGDFYLRINPSGYITRSTGDLIYLHFNSGNTGRFILDDSVNANNSLDFNPNNWFFIRGTGGAEINFYNSTPYVSGFKIVSDDIRVSGKSVLIDASKFISSESGANNTQLVLKDSINGLYPFIYSENDVFTLSGINGKSYIDLYDSKRNYANPIISGFEIDATQIRINGQIIQTGISANDLINASGVLNDKIESLESDISVIELLVGQPTGRPLTIYLNKNPEFYTNKRLLAFGTLQDTLNCIVSSGSGLYKIVVGSGDFGNGTLSGSGLFGTSPGNRYSFGEISFTNEFNSNNHSPLLNLVIRNSDGRIRFDDSIYCSITATSGQIAFDSDSTFPMDTRSPSAAFTSISGSVNGFRFSNITVVGASNLDINYCNFGNLGIFGNTISGLRFYGCEQTGSVALLGGAVWQPSRYSYKNSIVRKSQILDGPLDGIPITFSGTSISTGSNRTIPSGWGGIAFDNYNLHLVINPSGGLSKDLLLTKNSGDSLYYSSSNPSDFSSKNYVSSTFAPISTTVVNTQSSTANNSLYLYDSAKSQNSLVFDSSLGSFKINATGSQGYIDIYNRSISGFDLTGIQKIDVKNLFVSGVPFNVLLGGANTGDLISMVDGGHNTGLILWSTGTNLNDFYFGGGNNPYYLQHYFRHSNGSVEYKNKIDLQNSTIDGFTITKDGNPVAFATIANTNSIFSIWNTDFSEPFFYFDGQAKNDFYLKGSDYSGRFWRIDLTSGAIDNFLSVKADTGLFTNLFVSGDVTSSGQILASKNYVTGLSGYLINLIQKSNAGVLSINSTSGTIDIAGAGNVQVSTAGQVITISGNTGAYASFVNTGLTGSFVQTTDNRILSFGGSVSFSNTVQLGSNIFVTGIASFQSGVSISGFSVVTSNETGQFYSRNNPSGYITGVATGNFITTGQTGLFYPRTGNPSAFIVPSQTGSFLDKNLTGNFLVSGNPNTDVSFRDISGRLLRLSSGIRLENDKYIQSKLTNNSIVDIIGLNENNEVVVGINHEIQIDVNGLVTIAPPAAQNISLITSGGGVTSVTGPFTISGKTVVTNADTGSLIDNGMTGRLTGSFYPLNSNPSNYLTSSNTGNFVDRGQTGSFVTSGNTGSFATTGYVSGISGILHNRLSSTGSTLLALIAASNAGVSSINSRSGTITLTGAGNVSVIINGQTFSISGDTGNYSSFALKNDTGNFVTINQTGNLVEQGMTGKFTGEFYPRNSNPNFYVTSSQTGDFVGHGETGVLSSSFYPLNTNPSNYITSSQTGNLVDNGRTGLFVTTGHMFNVSGVLDTRLQTTGNTLLGLISAASAGVSSINASSGSLTFTGAGNVSIIKNGQTFTFSGNTGEYANFVLKTTTGNLIDNGRTGAFISTGMTGKFVDSGITGRLSGEFYPRTSNPANYVTGSVVRPGDTGLFVTTSQTGDFVGHGETGVLLTEFVSHSETGTLSNQFYPLNNNPSNYINSSQTGSFATTGYVSGISGILNARLQSTGNTLLTLIAASNAGVSSINGRSGTITLTGAGSVNVSVNGQTFTFSGQTGYVLNEETGNFVNLTENRNVLFNGNVIHNTIGKVRKTLDFDADYYPLVAYSKSDALVTGAWVLNTKIPRTSNTQFQISVRGQNSSAGGTTGNVDFTIFGYAQAATSGNIDGLPGATHPAHMSIRDNGTLPFNKYLGINRSGCVAIAFGDAGTKTYFQRMYADVAVVWNNNTGLYLTGYDWTLETGITFDWCDRTQLSGLQTHLHDAQQIIAGVLPSGRLIGEYPGIIGFVSPSETGNFTTSNYVDNISGVLNTRLTTTGSTLLALINASSAGVSSINTSSGALTFTGAGNVSVIKNGQTFTFSGNTGDYSNFVLNTNTGNLVDRGQTGRLTGQFYPLASNPSNYITTSQTGSFATTGYVSGISGILDSRLRATGNTLLTLISASNAGVLSINSASGALTFTGGGNVIVSRNGQQFTFSGDTGNYDSFVNTGRTGNFIDIGQTGVFVDAGKTGIYNNSFYPLNSNPSNYVTTSQTGSLVSQFINLNEHLQVVVPGLMLGGVEGDLSYPVWGGYQTNALTNWLKRGGTLNTSVSGGVTSITNASGTVTPEQRPNVQRLFCSIARNNSGIAVFEFTGIPFSLPANAAWEAFVIGRNTVFTNSVTGLKVEFLDNIGNWNTVFNSTPLWSGMIWASPQTLVSNFPLQGAKFTFSISSGISALNPAELGIWAKNYIRGTNLYAFQFGDVNFKSITGDSLSISGTNVVLATQTGDFLSTSQTGQFVNVSYINNISGILNNKISPVTNLPSTVYLSQNYLQYRDRGNQAFNSAQDVLNYISGSGSGIYRVIVESGNFGTGALTGTSPANRYQLGEIIFDNQFGSLQTPHVSFNLKNIDARFRLEKPLNFSAICTTGLVSFDSVEEHPSDLISPQALILTNVTGTINGLTLNSLATTSRSNLSIDSCYLDGFLINGDITGLTISNSEIESISLVGGTWQDRYSIINSKVKQTSILDNSSNGIPLVFSGNTISEPQTYILPSGYGGFGYSSTGLFLVENYGSFVTKRIITSDLTGQLNNEYIKVVNPTGRVVKFNPIANTSISRGNAILAAQTFASSGDTIFVNAGQADLTGSIGKNGVNWWFAPNSHILRTDGLEVITDMVNFSPSPMSFTIDGQARFENNNASNVHTVHFEHPNSNIFINCQSIFNNDTSLDFSSVGIYIGNSNVTIKATDFVKSTDYDAVWIFESGKLNLETNLISGADQGIETSFVSNVNIKANHIHGDTYPFSVNGAWYINANKCTSAPGASLAGSIGGTGTLDVRQIFGQVEVLTTGNIRFLNTRISGFGLPAINNKASGLSLHNCILESSGLYSLSGNNNTLIEVNGILTVNKPIHPNLIITGGAVNKNGLLISSISGLEGRFDSLWVNGIQITGNSSSSSSSGGAAGVSSLNSVTGAIILTGAAGHSVIRSGQTFFFSGSTGFVSSGETGRFDLRYIKRGLSGFQPSGNNALGLFHNSGSTGFFYEGDVASGRYFLQDHFTKAFVDLGGTLSGTVSGRRPLISGFNISGATGRFTELWVGATRITGNTSTLTGFTGVANTGSGSGIFAFRDNNTLVLKSLTSGIGTTISGNSGQLAVNVNLNYISIPYTGFTGIIGPSINSYVDLIVTGVPKGIWLINAMSTMGQFGLDAEYSNVAMKVWNGNMGAHTGWAIGQVHTNGAQTNLSIQGIANITSNTGSQVRLSVYCDAQTTFDSSMGLGTSGIGNNGSSGISPTQLTLVRIG